MFVASASSDKTIRIWVAKTGECMQTLEGHSGMVDLAVFSNNSKLVASASDDKTARIWCTETGECMQTLEVRSDLVKSVAFSHDSRLVASGSDDKTLRIWCVETGECMQTIECYGHWVHFRSFLAHDDLEASVRGHRECPALTLAVIKKIGERLYDEKHTALLGNLFKDTKIDLEDCRNWVIGYIDNSQVPSVSKQSKLTAQDL